MHELAALELQYYLEFHLQQGCLLCLSNQQVLLLICEGMYWLVAQVAYGAIWVEGIQHYLTTQGRLCNQCYMSVHKQYAVAVLGRSG